MVALALVEAETIRLILHTNQSALSWAGIALRTADGALIEASTRFLAAERALKDINDETDINDDHKKRNSRQSATDLVDTCVQCLRFVNNDMYFTPREIELLQTAFRSSPVSDRIRFFEDCLRLRRRERHLWGDTPLAQVFTEEGERHLLRVRTLLQQMKEAIRRAIKKRRIDPIAAFSRHDTDHDGSLSYTELQQVVSSICLGFSAGDIADVVRFCDRNADGLVPFEDYLEMFDLTMDMVPEESVDGGTRRAERWQCTSCTYVNFASDKGCYVCGYGRDGHLLVPPKKWMCDVSQGGCSFFNDETQFYCEQCDLARPSLASVRF
jgi:hypothetical protein